MQIGFYQSCEVCRSLIFNAADADGFHHLPDDAQEIGVGGRMIVHRACLTAPTPLCNCGRCAPLQQWNGETLPAVARPRLLVMYNVWSRWVFVPGQHVPGWTWVWCSRWIHLGWRWELDAEADGSLNGGFRLGHAEAWAALVQEARRCRSWGEL